MTIKSRKFTTSLVLTASCCLCFSIASAQSIWDGSDPGNNNFTDNDNWDNNIAPTPGGNNGVIPGGFNGANEINLNTAVNNFGLVVDGDSSLTRNGQVIVSNGGTLNLNGTSTLNATTGSGRVFVQSGGQLTVGDALDPTSNATFNALTRPLRIDGVGSRITLERGTINTSITNPSFELQNFGSYVQNGGTLNIVEGDINLASSSTMSIAGGTVNNTGGTSNDIDLIGPSSLTISNDATVNSGRIVLRTNSNSIVRQSDTSVVNLNSLVNQVTSTYNWMGEP